MHSDDSPGTQGDLSLFFSATEAIAPEQASQIAYQEMHRALAAAGTYGESELLGQGGMGVVHLSEQKVLGRKVALKTLNPKLRSDRSALALMREGWVTGSLEHPNIVPVHDIRADDGGSPQIVLKRIEGHTWSDVLANPKIIQEEFGSDRIVEWHLRVLMQVCNAVDFAHSRQIVHRDIKPDNVMIGSFGEVYLLDWGLAVTEDESSRRLPTAASATAIAGTPAYMAPEMLGGDNLGITKQTDIYLLGATLFEIVTGGPPHTGETLRALMYSVMEHSPPSLEDSIPIELRRMISVAMQAKPSDRQPSVKRFKMEIESYLQHRHSRTMSDEATQKFNALSAFTTTQPFDLSVRPLFAEIRYGFRTAIAAWSKNAQAHEGLRLAYDTMIRIELEQGQTARARTLMEEAPEVDESLEEEVMNQLNIAWERKRELESLHTKMNSEIGRFDRARLTLAFGAFSIGSPFLFDPDSSIDFLLLLSLIFLVGALMLIGFAPKSTRNTKVNHIWLGSVLVVAFVQLGTVVSGKLAGATGTEVLIRWPVIWSAATAMVGIAVDKRMLGASALYLGCAMCLEIGIGKVAWVLAITQALVYLPLLYFFYHHDKPAQDRLPR